MSATTLTTDMLRDMMLRMTDTEEIKRANEREEAYRQAAYNVIHVGGHEGRNMHQLEQAILKETHRIEVLQTGRANGKTLLAELLSSSSALTLHPYQAQLMKELAQLKPAIKRKYALRKDMQGGRVERMIETGTIANLYTAFCPPSIRSEARRNDHWDAVSYMRRYPLPTRNHLTDWR